MNPLISLIAEIWFVVAGVFVLAALVAMTQEGHAIIRDWWRDRKGYLEPGTVERLKDFDER